MLNFFKNKEKDFSSLENKEKESLIANILIECAMSDGNLGDDEEEKIKNILSEKLNIDDSELNDFFTKAINDSNNRVELYSLTKKIRENFSHEEIMDIFVYMWEVILIDNRVDDFESGLMRKATGLFHLSGKDSAEARNKAKSTYNKK